MAGDGSGGYDGSGADDGSAPGDVAVREATPADRIPVLNVLDAAMLDTSNVERRLAAGDVLVAVEGDRVLGALVLGDVGERIDSIAVRRARRGQGIGSALVNAAAGRTGLIAEFDGRNRPFYRSLGFEIERIGPDRFRGRRPAKP